MDNQKRAPLEYHSIPLNREWTREVILRIQRPTEVDSVDWWSRSSMIDLLNQG